MASSAFYLTILVVFVASVVGAVVTRWKRDACLKLMRGYHVTVTRPGGRTIWGTLKVLSSGVELCFDHDVADAHGRVKRSFLIYEPELPAEVASLWRFHDELSAEGQQRRRRQAEATFNPNLARRAWRGVRNLINTLKDAFGQALSLIVGRLTAGRAAVADSSGRVDQIGQTLLGGVANAYEPLLEQYIGQPVILDLPDAADGGTPRQVAGYLAEYTSAYVAVFNVEHAAGEPFTMTVDTGDEPVERDGLTLTAADGRLTLTSRRSNGLTVVRRIERGTGFEPLELGCTLMPGATLSLPYDADEPATLVVQLATSADVVAPRKSAVVRHAGDELPGRALLEQLPWVRR